jgi:hypothetical protein
MTTKTLPEMVDMVSSILTDYPVTPRPFYNLGIIVISTPIWDFTFTKLDKMGYYLFDNVVTNSSDLAEEMKHTKKTIMREVISKYGMTSSF